MRAPEWSAELPPAHLQRLVEVLKVGTPEHLLSADTAKVAFGGSLGECCDGPAGQAEAEHEAAEEPPDPPLAPLVVAEDGVADHHVTEGGDTHGKEPVPGDEEHVIKEEAGAELGRPKLVPGRLHEDMDGHSEDVGEAVADDGGVEAGPLLAPDDDCGPGVDDGGGRHQGGVGPGIGRGPRLVHLSSARAQRRTTLLQSTFLFFTFKPFVINFKF